MYPKITHGPIPVSVALISLFEIFSDRV